MNSFRVPTLFVRTSSLSAIGQWLAKLLIASLLLSSPRTWAQNFSTNEPELRSCAEAAREHSARFWSGQPLPGPWSNPCPVDWSQRTGSGSGMTRFQIHGGEVFGWQMTLCGNREAVLRDVIPHEVDHAVRASLCRRPLPRWLDEGCASLFESADSHKQLRRVRLTSQDRKLNAATIDQLNYPASSADTAQLYAEGFSLVEYLLARGTPQQILQIHRTSEPPSRSLVSVYRAELPQLLTDWSAWEQKRLVNGTRCDCVNCPCHRQPNATRPSASQPQTLKPTLTIWTASWCGPCLKFHTDLASQAKFRERLETQFQLIERDFDQSSQDAQRARVSRVPSFVTKDRHVEGYLGPEWLLRQLGLEETTAPVSSPVVTPVVVPAIPPVLSPPQPLVPTAPRAEPVKTPAAESRPKVVKAIPPAPIPWKAPSLWSRIVAVAPTAITILSSLGIIGGTAVTGGVGGVALMLLLKILQRRATRAAQGKSSAVDSTRPEGGAASSDRAPFPRQLDEAGELLGLRQSEGRVATLDTLRGMFLDDELDKLKDDPDSRTRAAVNRIFSAINNRVDEAAPLITKG